MKRSLMLLALAFLAIHGQSQSYDLLIRNGRVIDPKNKIDAKMDIAVSDGKIAKVAAKIEGTARQTIDATDLVVTPGLIDIHGHVFHGTQEDHYLSDGLSALPPDGFTLRVGVTTIVDCGGAGWRNFSTFKKNVIDKSTTRVLSFLNIVGHGMRGGNWEQDIADMDPKLSANTARGNKAHIVGFKLAHYSGYDWTPTERVVEAGKQADMPVIIDFGGARPNLSLEELFLRKLRPGDIYTHTYTKLDGSRETIVDETTNTLRPYMQAARARGIVFDVGYGGASFNYTQAIPALKAGFFPTTISTDLHTGSMNTSMKDQLSVMSKFMQMGMPLAEVIKASSWSAAKAIKREELGHLSEGAEADIAILNIRKGNFGFYDKTGYKV
ncbi:MAG: amidohydrolase/deacetylase family metallohydrolase, partial [Chitinophagaceae bacterium]|nr:amidohydrolase/deacetylase family metallohydrolase [Chitinophagaceae bacterium]